MGQINFIPRTLDDIENTADNRHGRVSYPILKGFMETNLQVAELDLAQYGKNAKYLDMSLKSYINNHDLPIKLVKRRGRLFLVRLDIDDKGGKIPNWKELLEAEKFAEVGDVEEITGDVIDEA